ncbi:TrbC/VirB2 family protein [Sphingomonas oryzagri]
MSNMLMTARKSLLRARHAGLVAMVTLMASPALADDPTNISNGLNSITTWVKTAAVPLGILAVMGAGFAKFAGRLDWPRFFSVLVGIGIVFGATQIVSWLSAGASGF